MEIRQLRPSDAVDYRELRLQALQNHPTAFGSSFEEEKERTSDVYAGRFQSENSYTFGAFENGNLIGSVTLITEAMKKMAHRATIVAMYVSAEHRQKGIGKSLIEAALEKAKELEKIEQVYLAVEATNEPAKRLYSSFGFEVYGNDKRALKIEDRYYDEELMILFL